MSTYNSWSQMIQRCTNPNNEAYPRYGGRGLKICPEWYNFKNFLEDMGECPASKTLERIDNNEGYYPDNCRWATYQEQSYNKRGYKNNKSGFRGVAWCKRQEQWTAYINVRRRRIFLGYFDFVEDAAMAREKAEDSIV